MSLTSLFSSQQPNQFCILSFFSFISKRFVSVVLMSLVLSLSLSLPLSPAFISFSLSLPLLSLSLYAWVRFLEHKKRRERKRKKKWFRLTKSETKRGEKINGFRFFASLTAFMFDLKKIYSWIYRYIYGAKIDPPEWAAHCLSVTCFSQVGGAALKKAFFATFTENIVRT